MVDEVELAESGPDLAERPDLAASRRPLVAGAAAGLWALLVGVALVTCVVMLAWAVSPDPAGDSAAAWRAAGMTWLGAHLVPLELGGRSLSLLPLGGLVLGLLLNRRGGRWAGRLLVDPTPGEAMGIVTAAAAVYGVGGAGLAWLSGAPGSAASPMVALLGTAAVALIGCTWGIAGAAGLVEGVQSRLSQAAWQTIRGGLAAVAGLVAAGCLLVSFGLLRHSYPAAATLADLDAGVLGGAALTVLGGLCVPTLGIWGLSVLVGPGFQIGAEDSLSVLGGQVDTLPALPVLAAVPAAMPGWAPLLLLVPVVLGGLAGRIRWGRDLPTVAGSVSSAVGLAGVVGVLVAGLVLLASGSLGGGRLESVGPQVLPVAAAAAGLVMLGFLADAGLQLGTLSWQLHRAELRAASDREQADQALVVPAGDHAVSGVRAGSTEAADPGDEGRPRAGADQSRRSAAGEQPDAGSRRSADDQVPDLEASDSGPTDRDTGDHTVDLDLSEQHLADVRAAARSHGSGPDHVEP
ncbi:MAG: DUF6350 family protein [Candidatus Nanopelagicales bacterium]